MTTPQHGLLVVFEGIDGAGKSTQIRRLGLLCQALGFECVSSREPTYGQYGKQLRDSAASGRLTRTEEHQLLLLDRREHLDTLVAPALALCRHFTASWLGTPWPDGMPGLPSLRLRAWRQVLHTLLWPTEPDDRPTLSKDAAAQLALLRYHQGRLPMRLLLPHLWHKWRTQHTAAAEEPPSAG